MLEAFACRKALDLLQDLGFNHICVMIDCPEVVNNLHKPIMLLMG
jgi:hypothetical protein